MRFDERRCVSSPTTTRGGGGRRSRVSFVVRFATVAWIVSACLVARSSRSTAVALAASWSRTRAGQRAASRASTATAVVVGPSSATTANGDASSSSSPRRWWRRRSSSGPSDGERGASWASRLTYSYARPVIETARERRLGPEDVFTVPAEERTAATAASLAAIHEEETRRSEAREIETGRRRARPSRVLAKSLLRHQKRALLASGALRLLNTSVQVLPALLVSRLLRSMETSAPPRRSIGLAVALVAVLVVKTVVENLYFHTVVKTSLRAGGALSGLVFDKSLRLPTAARGGGARKKRRPKKRRTASRRDEEKDASSDAGVADAINLLQTDVGVIESLALQIHTTWDGPLQIVVYASLLFRFLGPAVWWGVGVLVGTIALNSVALRALRRLAGRETEARDARARATAEALRSMRAVKSSGWEDNLRTEIELRRGDELARRAAASAATAASRSLSYAVPSIAFAATLSAYARSGRPVTASVVFASSSLFNQLRFPLFFLPILVDAVANGRNSLRRLSDYLGSQEVVNYTTVLEDHDDDDGVEEGGMIELRNGNFLWDHDVGHDDEGTGGERRARLPALRDAELTVRPGEVVAVVGSVGGGKTALVRALLGELAPVPRNVVVADGGSGAADGVPRVLRRGALSYCAQEAWLSKGSLRDAIVFGEPYDERRYLDALRDAGLEEDVRGDGPLPDDLDVGEGGSALSGGQRARAALARALYGRGRVYLLDDPLSALDASVRATVFDRLTARFEREKAAVVLVTNDPSLRRRCDRVVLMGKDDQGCPRIVDVGTYDELLRRGHDLSDLNHHGEEVYEEEEVTNDVVVDSISTRRGKVNGSATLPAENDIIDDHDEERNEPTHGPPTMRSNKESKDNVDDVEQLRPSKSKPRGRGTLRSTDDNMSTGAVPRSTYVSYLRSVKKPILFVGVLASFLLVNAAQVYQQFVVAQWTEASAVDALSSEYTTKLAKAAACVAVFLFVRSLLLARVGLRASAHLHSAALRSVFAAPASFFDATPSGQLLSRLGKEMDAVDRALPDGLGSVLYCFLQMFAAAASLSAAVTPALALPLVGAAALHVRVTRRFRPASRDAKRAASTTRAPVVTHLGEALRGAETIRSAPSGLERWATRHRELTDDHLAVVKVVKSLDRWLSLRLETLGNGVVLLCAVVSVHLSKAGRLNAGRAGWGVTQALSITGLLTWAVRCLTDLETQMMSVARVNEIVNDREGTTTTTTTNDDDDDDFHAFSMPRELSKPGEALRRSSLLRLPPSPPNDEALVRAGWPWSGEVEFDDVSARHDPVSPRVLKGVTLRVPPGSTLGVVGRTGSGKSSLLSTLFRILEIEKGSVRVDGVDVRGVGLDTLRRSLSVVPQDPVLFAGTLGRNLDAAGEHAEEEARAALAAASPALARESAAKNGDGLGARVAEGGTNLSLGQRQLVCLARALLRRRKILVLDEATSSVDPTTDARIQTTIRREFVDRGVTVLTVAHRLDTVLGYDKVCVLNDGEVSEYGPPNELLKKEHGELRRLVQADRRHKRKGEEPSTKANATPLAQIT